MAKLIHSMVRVLDEKRSVEFYKQAFGLEVAERAEFENFTLIYLSNAEGDFELELTVNRGREVPYALGDGYGHLAVSVADVDAEHQRFNEIGLSPGKIIEADYKGQPFAKYFHLRSRWLQDRSAAARQPVQISSDGGRHGRGRR